MPRRPIKIEDLKPGTKVLYVAPSGKSQRVTFIGVLGGEAVIRDWHRRFDHVPVDSLFELADDDEEEAQPLSLISI